jgi:CBS domain-containing protein
MTSPVITVGPQTPIPEIAALLLEHRISGVPVLEDGRLVGLVSEADLLHRHEIGTARTTLAGPGWLRLFGADRSASEYVKSHAGLARDIMTREVVSIGPDTAVAEIVAVLETRGIKRVPVLRGKELVGMVSRANLIKALAQKGHSEKATHPGNDETIRGRLVAELQRQPWWRPLSSNVIVAEGVVHYWGIIDSRDERDAARVAAENIAGVRRVEDHRFMMNDIPAMV